MNFQKILFLGYQSKLNTTFSWKEVTTGVHTTSHSSNFHIDTDVLALPSSVFWLSPFNFSPTLIISHLIIIKWVTNLCCSVLYLF